MGSVANPLWSQMGMVPGATTPSNPTGTNVNIGTGTSTTGSNPLLPSPGSATSAPTSTNPVAAGFPANTGGGYQTTSLTSPTPMPATNAAQAAGSPIGGMSTMSPTDISRLYGSLKKTYGDGAAHALLDFLTSGAGFNQSAINNLFASLQPGIERGEESLMTQFSASGNRFGSGAQIGLGDFESQVNLNEGQLETQMYEQSINDYLSVLMGTSSAQATTKANSPSTLDSVLGGLNLGGTAAGAASSSGLVSGTTGTIFDTLASAGAVV